MKRIEVERILRKAGFQLREGGNHTHILDQSGRRISCLGRHNELKDYEVAAIEEQTGVTLRKRG